MSALFSRFRRLVTLDPRLVTFGDTPDEAAFQAHAQDLTLRNIRAAAVFIFLASLLAWLVDLAVYRTLPAVLPHFFWLRAIHALVGIVTFVLLRYPPLARRVNLVTAVSVTVASFTLGSVTGRLGDLGTPWFHFTYTAVIGLFVPAVALPVRALLGLLFSGAMVAGFALVRPLLPAHPMLVPTLAFLTLTTGAGVAIGHVVHRLVEQGFYAARAKSKASHELGELNRTLEARVRRKTRELRLLAAHIEDARETERARIARELHDELGQELTALRYTVTFLRQRYQRDPGSIEGNLDELEGLLGRTAATTRNLVSELRPPVLDELGLAAAVEWLLQRTEERTALVCRLSSGEQGDISGEAATAAFRIVQEALTNVVKHARASRVDVAIGVREGALEVSVRDDGVGLPPSPRARPRGPGKGGMGLIGMRERAGALGGELRVQSGKGGTTLSVRLPLGARPSGSGDDSSPDAARG